MSDITPYVPHPGAVTVFSAEWCGHCTQLKTMLAHEGIPYREIMIEEDAIAEQIANEANGGSWLIPTVVFSDGSVRVHPGLNGTRERLGELGEL